MSVFDVLIVQPIFNLLIAIYGLIPGGDFGLSIILFTVIVRLLMWPLVKKQLHQTKVMRAIQPELKKLKAKAKGNRQLEAQLMMELYRERGVSPFGSIGLLLLQLPIFIALFVVINIITRERDRIGAFTYDFLEQLPRIGTIINDPAHQFNTQFLGIFDLAKTGLGSEGVYLPLILLAAVAAFLQYIQSKQVTPEPTTNKRLRDIFKASASGAQVDQSEVSALMSRRMIVLFPFITFLVTIYLPGALVLYYAVTSAVAVIQQHIVLERDVEEMEDLADKKTPKSATKVRTFTETDDTSAKSRAASAREATVVKPPKKKKQKKRKQR